MAETDMLEVARKMRGPDGVGRVFVLDVDQSSSRNGIVLPAQANRHAYYLRPPDGTTAFQMKEILDQLGGEESLGFRYYTYPELQTDLKPLLTVDLYAGRHFMRDEERRYLQIEGERPKARQAIAELLEGLKEPFRSDHFPRIDEFDLLSFRPASENPRAELVLLRRDRERDELRKSEPGFHVAVAEHGLAKEIEIHRPVVAGTEPILILNSNDHTTPSGHLFFADLAAYFGTEAHAERAKVADQTHLKTAVPATQPRIQNPPSHAPRSPEAQPIKIDDQQLAGKLATAMKELLPNMKLLRKRELSRSGSILSIHFPGVLGFGKGPSPAEIKELGSVFLALKADPTFGLDWRPRYQVDPKTGDVRIASSSTPPPGAGWTDL